MMISMLYIFVYFALRSLNPTKMTAYVAYSFFLVLLIPLGIVTGMLWLSKFIADILFINLIILAFEVVDLGRNIGDK